MTNRELWEKYTNFTQDLSTNARNLAYVAAGLSWAFKTEAGEFPGLVIVALRCVILFFMADILQYVSGALFVRCWVRSQEKAMYAKTKSIEGDYEQPGWLDTPPLIFLWIKIAALLVAYIYLGMYIFK